MKQWRCTVCGYVHTGDEPPEKCPVCGADRSKFVELTPEETGTGSPETASVTQPVSDDPGEPARRMSGREKTIDFILSQMVKHHIHPISAHIPNGVLPVSVLFVFVAVVLNFHNLALASFYNMIVVLLAMPLVLYSGYNEWQRKYGGNRTTYFTIKIICGAVVLLCAVAAVIWGALDPTVTLPYSENRGLFLLLHLIMLAAAGLAGFIGGKLVFKD
ncbi:MAG: rubredoxin-like domain-containing protein [Thermodesulfobacteriota bacterium]